jgi:diphosphomevalonate decarboxylase
MNPDEFKGSSSISSLKTPVSVCWRSPSNIALVKYWGKKGNQLPVNPSISLTLSGAYTETKIEAFPSKPSGQVKAEVYFEGSIHEGFNQRILGYLNSISGIFPYLLKTRLKIETHNTFPHSAGIASSASGFSALALGLCSLQEKLSKKKLPDFYAIASHLARLGSGSACRSLYGGFTIWGENATLRNASDRYAIPLTDIHPIFEDLRDAILLIGKGEKKVSSSAGHGRMENHPFADARISQANWNTAELLEALRCGDVNSFIRITENEALTLHALMMASLPGFILMEPETVEIIQKIQDFRTNTRIPVCFTLDAGPNIHLLFFEQDREQVNRLIVEDLLKKNKQNNWLDDGYGKGPVYCG